MCQTGAAPDIKKTTVRPTDRRSTLDVSIEWTGDGDPYFSRTETSMLQKRGLSSKMKVLGSLAQEKVLVLEERS